MKQELIFGERLKYAIKFRNMSQSKLSDKSGASKESISQYVTGKSLPQLDMFRVIYQVLDVNPAWLLGDNVSMGSATSSDEDKFILIYKALLDDDKQNLYNYTKNVLLISDKYKNVQSPEDFLKYNSTSSDKQMLLDNFTLLDDNDRQTVLKFVIDVLLSSPKYQHKKETTA